MELSWTLALVPGHGATAACVATLSGLGTGHNTTIDNHISLHDYIIIFLILNSLLHTNDSVNILK